MQADEGCGSICDANGNLLFYTNGVTVYNRKHEIMLNGQGLLGHVSAMQSAIIVQQLDNENMFYIFTSDAFETDFANGYRYSIVNMQQDNGYGAVVSKNTVLSAQSSERITAARHANGSDVWVITNDRNSNIFRSWLVDCNGLQTTPVVSTVGEILNFHTLASVGILKVSPDGRQLCQTHYPDPNDPPGAATDFYQLFDFNNATGVISNPVKVNSVDVSYFGCEYSPSSQLLFLCTLGSNVIDQFESRLPTLADIAASRVRIPTDAAVTGLQLGPNGKIYLARPGAYIDVINSPDTKGPGCDYHFEHIFLKGKTSQLQLPAMINDLAYDPHNQFTFQILDSCSGNVQFYGHTALPGTIQWQWDFGDGNTSTQQNPIHQFNPTGQTYTVTLSISSSLTCTRKFKIIKQVAPSGQVSIASFEFKPICDSGYVRFTNTSDPVMATNGVFLWNFGDGNTSTEMNPVHTYALPGNYTVQLSYTTNLACLNDVASHTIDLQIYPVSTIPDQTIFVSQAVKLLVTAQQGVSFQWSPPLWLDNADIRSPLAVPLDDIVYTVSVTNQNGCVGKDSVFIRVLPLDDIYIPTGFTPNGDGKNETFYPLFGTHLTLKEFSVFNRWGQRVFSTQMRGYGWNGKINDKLQGSGVFVYIVRLVDATGKLYDKKGTLTLIR